MPALNKDWLLPWMSWKEYEKKLKLCVEDDESTNDDAGEFLKQLGFLTPDTLASEVSDFGQEYYDTLYIRNDRGEVDNMLKTAVLKFAPAEAILQLLHGVENAKRDNALAILKSRGFWYYTDESPLTHLLALMNQAGLVSYSKKHRTLRVLHNVKENEKQVPNNIFVDQNTPYSNIEWLRRVLKTCTGHIFWLDKHFLKIGLSYIWEIADANKVTQITIVSLSLKEHDKSTTKEYRRLKEELAHKGIELKWLVINSTKIRDSHDRWILTEQAGWNLPDLGTIIAGNRSEINTSPNYKEVTSAFNDYKGKAKELGT